MQVAKDGRIIRWRSQDGNTGTAAITIPAPLQASTLLALPRVFPRRTPPAAQPEAPPALAGPPPARLQEPAAAPAPAEFVAAATPPALPPAASATVTETDPAPPAAPPPVPAVKQVEAKQPEARTASASPPKRTEPGQQAEPKRAASPTFMVTNVRPDDVLNVRSGPSADHDIVAELAPGSRGIAITNECRSRWCPVQHDGATGWVNSVYLVPEGPATTALKTALNDGPASPALSPPPNPSAGPALRDSPEAPRSCLKPAARALLDRIEQKFGPVQVLSTCRAGAMIAGTSQPSRHASGNAVDFRAGPRKAAILAWLIATHRAGGTMTYAGMDHIHVDIGPHFISLAGGRHTSSWRGGPREASGPRAAGTQR
jgi:hypothetical protein